jgi:hypothetical protein
MDAVIRIKDERLLIVKDALALFKCHESNKEWGLLNKGVKNIQELKLGMRIIFKCLIQILKLDF